jgi:extracellular elastinolytic metalloproteinase
MSSSSRGLRRVLVPIVAILTAVGLGFQPVGAAPTKPQVRPKGPEATSLQSKLRYYDARQQLSDAAKLSLRDARLMAKAPAALRALHDKLGVQGIVDIDPVTGTPRVVAKLDGFLTGRRQGSARTIGLDYLRQHQAAFGITADTLSTLTFVRDYVSIDGTHHVYWRQSRGGIPVFGSGVQINITKDGRVINVIGSPVAGLANAPTSARVDASKAIQTAIGDSRLTNVTGLTRITAAGNAQRLAPTATRVYFPRPGGVRLGWQTYLQGREGMYLSVVDASNGKMLFRRSLTDSAKGQVFENYPNAKNGGDQKVVNFDPFLFASNRLFGNAAWVYSDVNDDNVAQGSEEIKPDKNGNWLFDFVAYHNQVNSPCVAKFPCSWDSRYPKGEGSWKTNRRQAGTQLFWFLNHFAKHLKKAPIGFNEAAGNFQLLNSSGEGFGGDPVLGQAMDGAKTLQGPLGVALPDPNHTDNANMGTPPDGFSPTMQMYLWNDPLTNAVFGPGSDPFVQADGDNEADIVYHEYTHGLSNRLVVDADGNSTLGPIQAGAMGEAWSDWYAMDFLVNEGNFVDGPADGQLLLGHYVSAGQYFIRNEPIDCPVGSVSSRCPGTATAGPGGFTYGDFGKVGASPEVHDDGEIWGQTLWDLRDELGSDIAEGIVTRGMELSPANPSFLDMRNSILQADLVDNAGANQDAIWAVFANRGMGYFASAINGDDTAPTEDFSLPPDPGSPTGDLTGNVADADTGDPVPDAVVAFGGHASGFPGDYVAVTDNNGDYEIDDIFTGTYTGVSAVAPGFDRQVKEVTIAAGANTEDWQLKFDWAASFNGASVTDFNGPDFSPDCGPGGAIDLSFGVGWGSTTDTDDGAETGNVTPKFIIVQLPQAVDISSIAIDPGNTCGDARSAATHDWTVETSTDGVTFTEAATGTYFVSNIGVLNTVNLAGGTDTNVSYIRFTMESPMVPFTGTTCDDNANCPSGTGNVAQRCGPSAPDPGSFSGCAFMDMREIEVYGSPSP